MEQYLASRKWVHQPAGQKAPDDHDQEGLEKQPNLFPPFRSPQEGEEHGDQKGVPNEEKEMIHQLLAPLAISETSKTARRFINPAVIRKVFP